MCTPGRVAPAAPTPPKRNMRAPMAVAEWNERGEGTEPALRDLLHVFETRKSRKMRCGGGGRKLTYSCQRWRVRWKRRRLLVLQRDKGACAYRRTSDHSVAKERCREEGSDSTSSWLHEKGEEDMNNDDNNNDKTITNTSLVDEECRDECCPW